MHKLWLIFKREYLIRVRKRSFILVTILMPLAFAGLAIGSGIISALGAQSGKRILVRDASTIFEQSGTDRDHMVFVFADAPLDSLKENYADQGYDMLVYIPPFNDLKERKHQAEYYASDKPGIVTLERIESVIAEAFREYKIEQSQIDRSLFESFKTSIDLESGNVLEGREKGSGKIAAIVGTILGGAMGVLMYMVILIYGQMILRSVMEEKINRIVEVVISSVKPFQLMLGKILGVGAVGLTQLAIWIILIPAALSLAPLFMPGSDPQQVTDLAATGQTVPAEINPGGFDLGLVLDAFFGLNWWLILPSFIVFFLGGYFIYASMFAAIGSAVDEDLGEAQQLMYPIIIPVILAFVMMMSTIENPNGGMAVFGSLFPLFSPIIMPARLPFDPPLIEVLISVALLLGTTLLFIWLSGRIYRVGILMYGKKLTLKELTRWMFYKG